MPQQHPLGQPIQRVDGIDKVTGGVLYAGDASTPGMLHAILVQAAIARGTIQSIDAALAECAPGVAAVYTHLNLPRLQPPPETFTESFPAERRAPLSDNVIHYAGQHIALVLAETLEEAQAAAARVRVDYKKEPPVLELRPGLPGAYQPDHFATNSVEKLQAHRGEPGPAAHTLAADYNTPVVTHNPMEPSATLAIWQGDRLTLHGSTRWVQGSRRIVAYMLGIPESNVRVICPFTGGPFGSKGFLWQHVALCAQAARTVGRPVRLELTRQQMFTSTGHRPRTCQTVRLTSDADVKLTSVTHQTLTETSPVPHFVEPAGMTSRNLYRTPHAVIAHTVAPLNLATPCFMRAPGESPGMFALDSAIDELAVAAGVDPLQFRLRNYADRDLQEDRPGQASTWSVAIATEPSASAGRVGHMRPAPCRVMANSSLGHGHRCLSRAPLPGGGACNLQPPGNRHLLDSHPRDWSRREHHHRADRGCNSGQSAREVQFVWGDSDLPTAR